MLKSSYNGWLTNLSGAVVANGPADADPPRPISQSESLVDMRLVPIPDLLSAQPSLGVAVAGYCKGPCSIRIRGFVDFHVNCSTVSPIPG